MLCVLRVSGPNIAANEITQATGLTPYRVDPACLHFDVAETDSDDWPAFVAKVAGFMSEKEQALMALGQMTTVTDKRLDIAIFFRTDQVMKTLELEPAILRQVVRLGLAVELSIYSTGERAV